MSLVHRFQWLRGTMMRCWILHWAPRSDRFSSLRLILQHELVGSELNDWSHYNFQGVVYVRAHCGRQPWYVGCTTLSLHEREQSRVRKFRQLQNDRLAFYEPALRWWKATGTFYEYIVMPVALRECEVRSSELSLQLLYHPKLNWPWISPLLKKLGLRAPTYTLNVTHAGVIGSQLQRRFSRLMRKRLSCGTMFRLRDQEAVLRLLHNLGSEGIAKFHVSRLLRSSSTSLHLLYYLARMTQHMSEPWRARAISQLRLILEFRGGTLPVANKVLRLLPVQPAFIAVAQAWLKAFCIQHRVLFPPLHVPRSPICEIRCMSLERALFNFHSFLRTWAPDFEPECVCRPFRERVPHSAISKATGHVCGFGSDIWPSEQLSWAHLQDSIWPTWRNFFSHNSLQFSAWLQHWKLPCRLIHYWNQFLHERWKQHVASVDTADRCFWAFHEICKFQNLTDGWIRGPADHFPHCLAIVCPSHYHWLLHRTFLDVEVFRQLYEGPMTILSRLPQFVPRQLVRQYSWGWAMQGQLPYAYLLPKPSRGWDKARPIVSYRKAWCSKIGQAISILLLVILETVFPKEVNTQRVDVILRSIWRIFCQNHVESEILLDQQDLAGFYNHVEHCRILMSVQFLICRYASLQDVSLDSDFSVTVQHAERIQRLFKGKWRRFGSTHRVVRLGDVVPIVDTLLRLSFFSIGRFVFQQTCGASMGSQWAPVLYSAVAVFREWTFTQALVNSGTWVQHSFLTRYVDNRIMVLVNTTPSSTDHDILRWPYFYGRPLVLETVIDDIALGFRIDTRQRSITLKLPTIPQLIRSHRSAGAEGAILSGFRARMLLVCRFVRPRRLIPYQAQDLAAMYCARGVPLRLLRPAIRDLLERFQLWNPEVSMLFHHLPEME